MTTSIIAVKVTNENIIIGSDSFTLGPNEYTQEQYNFIQLREVNDMVIGSSGHFHESSLFFKFAETKRIKPVEADIVAYFLAFQERVKTQIEGGSYQLTSEYILLCEGKVFTFANFIVHEVTDFTAVGIGAAYALAALSQKHSVEEAIDVACELCGDCERPVHNRSRCEVLEYCKIDNMGFPSTVVNRRL